MRKARKAAAKRVSAVLSVFLSALILLGGFPLLGGRGVGRAATNDYIGTTSLADVFNWENRSGYDASKYGPKGNNFSLLNTNENKTFSVDGLPQAGSYFLSKHRLSLEADWELSGAFNISFPASFPKNAMCVGNVVLHAGVYGDNEPLMAFAAGKEEGKTGPTVTVVYRNASTNYSNLLAENVDATHFGSAKSFHLSYDAKTHILSFNYDDTSLTANIYDVFSADVKDVQVRMSGLAHFGGGSLISGCTMSGTFSTAAYTGYSPEFVETKLLKANGSAFATGEIPKNGDTVIVQAKVKNNNTKASTQAVPCTLKLLQNDRDYPTAGIVPLTDREGQQIVANGAPVPSTTDIIGDGIPFKMTGAGDNIITYKAKINNPTGAAVTVGQAIADTFFQSRRCSKAELVPAVELVPQDPDAQPEPGQPAPTPGSDYHYTRTPANENGWNNTPVDLTFHEGTFDQFNVKKGNAVDATLTAGNPTKQYAGETDGTAVTYQAQNSQNGAISTVVNDTIKVDTTAPTLAAGAGKSLALGDSLSGVWKLERQDPATGGWSAANTFVLTNGNGSPSQSVTPTKNGVYRAVDAAGNVSDATLPVTVNDPPEIGVENPHHHSPQGPTNTTDQSGLVHAVYQDAITEILSDPPAYGGALTAGDLQAIIESRYQFAPYAGSVSGELVSMTQNGTDIAATGLSSSTPGSCQAVYTVTDQDGNTSTLNLTFSFIEKPLPPTVTPADPEETLPAPSEEIDAENRVHHRYTDAVTELISDPPAYGGTFTAADALAYIKGHYAFAAQTGDALTEAMTMTRGGADIAATGLDSSAPGSCLITYTVTDRDGNTAALELTYAFKARTEPPAVDPADPAHPLPEPEEEVDKNGLVHQTYRDQIVKIIADPPEFGGSLSAEKLKEIVESRYTFGPGDVSFAMTQNGADIAATGLDSSTPGSCLGAYIVADSQGNTTTLLLTYTYIEKPDPPAVVPADPENPPEGPQETVNPDNTVHHRYTDTVVELISDPPAYGGHFTIGDALGYIRDHYDFAAGSASLTGHALSMEQEGDPVVEISSAVPGSCLITYTVTDRDGNSTTLELTYIFKERVEPPLITPIDPENPPLGPEETVDRDGSVHHTYRDRIVVPITDPPQFGGLLTPEKLREIIEERYAFGPGEVSFSMSTAGLPSTRPGSCTGTYTVTDEMGNSTTLELTYEYAEHFAPPVITPADPERPLPTPEEVTDPNATVHRTYRDGITEQVSYPPAFGGSLSAQEALDWLRGQYQIAPGSSHRLRETIAISQDGADITPQGFATDREGSCLITYTVTDEYGNSSTLLFSYTLKEKGAANTGVVPDPDGGKNISGQGSGSGPYTGDSGWADSRGCSLHWLILGLALLAALYVAVRCRRLDREEEDDRVSL